MGWTLFAFAMAAVAALTVMLFVQYRRFTAVISALNTEFEHKRNEFGAKTRNLEQETEHMRAECETLIKKEDELTQQNFVMAEANLSVLAQKELLDEQTKRLERQTFAMAEANLTMLELKEKLTAQTETLEQQKFAMADANLQLVELNEKLECEKEKSAKLLRNILPERVIAELGEKGSSEPELFENVTVFFSDIVGFTTISGGLAPAVLIAELNDVFTEFDHIFVRNRCERIKTIGDAYLSVSGMPAADENHYANVLRSALEARACLERRNATRSRQWHMRMGIHSGPVVGGIVGVEKYIYDVFGDTINTAARMEQHSDSMQINVSEATYMLAKDKFDFIERPPQNVKGKGMLKMYFLIAEKAPSA